MNKGQMNLQDVFLNQVRKEHVPVTIYLVGGVQLKGLIKGFDSFTVMLDSPGKPTQIVYKHAIASVVPSRQVMLPQQEPQDQPEQPKVQAEEQPEQSEQPKEEAKAQPEQSEQPKVEAKAQPKEQPKEEEPEAENAGA